MAERLESDKAAKTIAELRGTLREALRRFKRYEMDVDTEPPLDHCAFMRRASALLVSSIDKREQLR